jgi:hypothetical protein
MAQLAIVDAHVEVDQLVGWRANADQGLQEI